MKFKCSFTACCILLFAYNVTYAQEANHQHNYGKIGITYTPFGTNAVDMDDYVCDCGYVMKGFYNVGLTYIYPVNHWLGIETGLEYSRQKLQIDSIWPLHHSVSQRNFTLWNIPLTVRFNFLHYFFANGGFLVTIDPDNDPNNPDPIGKQTGLGALAGLGARYEFKMGLSLFVNPYMKFYSNIVRKSPYSHFKLWEGGYRFGITYRL
jgi:hypothetical protein